jgi:tetratricopeptide (TPR) repeat protein
VHELVEGWFEEKHLPVLELEATIHHFGKIDFERDLAKQTEYTRLAKAEAQERPEDPEAHYNVIQEALMIEDWEAVLQAARQYLALKPSAPLLVYLGAAMACQGLGRASEALTYLKPVLAKDPSNTAALCVRGDALAALGRPAEAQQDYLSAIEVNPAFTLPFLKLSELLGRSGDTATARQILEAGLDQNPKDLVLWTSLVGLAAKSGDERVASDAWDALQAVPDGGKGIWHLLVAHGLLSRGAKAEARLVLDQGLKAFPVQSELIALRERIGNS